MEKKILAVASYKKEKYFFESEFSQIPESIKEEIRVVCVVLAQKLGCTFAMGFYEGGNVYFEIIKDENEIDFDDIGAELEIKNLKKEKADLIKALKLWYIIFKTEEGQKFKNQLLLKNS